jgi:hypothetical protein
MKWNTSTCLFQSSSLKIEWTLGGVREGGGGRGRDKRELSSNKENALGLKYQSVSMIKCFP